MQVANLALQAVNGIGNDSQIDMDVDTVAALEHDRGRHCPDRELHRRRPDVGTVDGVVGIRNTASAGFSPILAIQLETNNGDPTVNSDIFTSRRNIFLVAQFGNGRTACRPSPTTPTSPARTAAPTPQRQDRHPRRQHDAVGRQHHHGREPRDPGGRPGLEHLHGRDRSRRQRRRRHAGPDPG
ncbi:MAG: hypothetical protein R3F55_03445 [Alphaproteobacteria bacterium]